MAGRPVIVVRPTYNTTPARKVDYCAYYDGFEERGHYGYGSTAAEALRDFEENQMDWHDEELGFADEYYERMG